MITWTIHELKDRRKQEACYPVVFDNVFQNLHKHIHTQMVSIESLLFGSVGPKICRQIWCGSHN